MKTQSAAEMYLGRSSCCLMSSPLVPPSGYFQLCTQDNDIFWAHSCSQGDNACDFNDHIAFPLGSTSSSRFLILNLPPAQIVRCNEHCCVWDLSRRFCIIICLDCVIFLLLHDYSSSHSVWGKCGGQMESPCVRAAVTCSVLAPDLTATLPPSVLTGSSGMLQICQCQNFSIQCLELSFFFSFSQ